ncbi:hypothetical protein [Fredinandcohnia onubensis]|uniref:hypothetical protein n=1 Tax=Fredinandcohnia onubensis TaxID=1571209 RepID=UPI000C0C0CE9|nr:hypothetical protein [Fredinandcohnia onubensis]
MKQFIRFKDSKINKAIKPVAEVLEGIDILETALFEKGYIDESVETMLISSYHMTYKKNGKEILIIRPMVSDWNVKLFGTTWNLQKLFQLPVSFEFEIEQTGWRIQGMIDANIDDIKKSFLEALEQSIIEQFIVYPLTIIHAYFLKNSHLFQNTDDKILNEVLSSFWLGDISRIKVLQDNFKSNASENNIHNFIKNWYEKVNVDSSLNVNQLHDRTKVDKQNFYSKFSLLGIYMERVFTNYRNSLSSIWFENELLQDKELFTLKMEEIRESILLTDTFLKELNQIEHKNQDHTTTDEIVQKVKEPSLTEDNQENNSIPDNAKEQSVNTTRVNNNVVQPKQEPNDWFEFLLKNKAGTIKDIPFMTKKELLGEDSNMALTIHEHRVEMLSSEFAHDKKMTQEFVTIIRLLIENSNSKGYVTKELLKSLYMLRYKDKNRINDYAKRNHISSSKVKQSLSTRFHVVLEQLKKVGLIKEYFRDYEYQIYWNFAIYVHK